MPAQPTKGLASRFIGDPNSTIGSLIKRGFTGFDNSNSVAASGQNLKSDQPIQPINSIQTQPTPLSKPTKTETTQALQTLERVINEVKTAMPTKQTAPAIQGALSQVMPQVVTQTIDQATTPQPVSGPRAAQKETAVGAVSLDQVAVDAARGAQLAEIEPTPEISPEVESYLQKVEDRKDMAPPEIVIADGSQTAPATRQYPSQPVVVLPITEEQEQIGAKKSPKFSLRWLVEWSRKIMKMFAGKVIYRSVKESVA